MMNSVFHEFEFTCTLSVHIIPQHLNCVCQMYHTCSPFNINSIQYQVMFVSEVIFNYTTNMKDQVLQTDVLFLHTKLGYGGFNALKMSLNILADLDSTTNSRVQSLPLCHHSLILDALLPGQAEKACMIKSLSEVYILLCSPDDVYILLCGPHEVQILLWGHHEVQILLHSPHEDQILLSSPHATTFCSNSAKQS